MSQHDQSPEAKKTRAEGKRWRSPKAKGRLNVAAQAKRTANNIRLFGRPRRRAPRYSDQSPEAKKARAMAGRRRWYERNLARWPRYCRKRRVQKLNLPYTEHETPMPADGRCPHCRVEMTGKTHKGRSDDNAPVPDHIIPLKPRRGEPQGHHVPENTMMICNQCNCLKGNRPLSYLLNKIFERDLY